MDHRLQHKPIVLILLAVAGMVLHFGTAALRVRTFVPYPRLRDFAGFYASAWALRQGDSPYGLTGEAMAAIQAEKRIPFRPPVIYNPPAWPWLLRGLTRFNFRAAAWLWLLINLGLLAWVAHELSHMAGYRGWRARAAIFLLCVTFGPTFLDLTLGQTSVVLLASGLAMGVAMRFPTGDGAASSDPAQQGQNRPGETWPIIGAVAASVAAAAKLFPVLWLGVPLLLRRWKPVLLCALAILAGLAGSFAVAPEANREYWFHYLPQRLLAATDEAEIDDQSIGAWVDRLGREHTYRVPGLRTSDRVEVVWDPPWSLPASALKWIGYALAGLLGLAVLAVVLRSPTRLAEGAFYLGVLYTLAIFPHIDRYNHTLLLPAMAWLWGQEKPERAPRVLRALVVIAYLLAGLSRLNHLWMILLPAPWGPLASGFGLCAVLLLGAGVARVLLDAKVLRREARA